MLRVCTSRAPVRGASHMSVPMCLFGATRFVSTGWSFGPGDCGRRRERRLGTFPAWPGSGAADRSLPGAKPAGSWTRPSAPAQVHSDCILQGWGLGPAAEGACQALRPHPSQPDSSPRISPAHLHRCRTRGGLPGRLCARQPRPAVTWESAVAMEQGCSRCLSTMLGWGPRLGWGQKQTGCFDGELRERWTLN